MAIDIRDKASIDHQDVVGLNFIRASAGVVFRRHYRSGLRSHIMEVLRPADVERENRGIVCDGMRWFPRAEPLKMLRIFRTRFPSLAQALKEIERVQIVSRFLGAEFLALSQEFLVDYEAPAGRDFLLCGLQEYVQGEPLDPWRPSAGKDKDPKAALGQRGARGAFFGQRLQSAVAKFVFKVKAMVRNTAMIPDLAGARNLMVTRFGQLKLVDINNISPVAPAADIPLDDKGYPVCDKSVEALYLLERRFLGRTPDPNDGIYAPFMDRDRLRRADALHRRFHHRATPGS